jgi:hypothetical protein
MRHGQSSKIKIAVAALAVALAVPAAARAAQSAAPARALLRLQLEGAARALVVGQSIPVTIRADFLAGTGVTLNGAPRVVSDGFTLSGVSDKPRQTEARRNGLPYTELTWTGVLTAIQAAAPAPAVELPVELSYREPVRVAPATAADNQQQDSPFASVFANTPFASDPFFAQMMKSDDFSQLFQEMGGAVRQREVTLRDQAAHVSVAPTPQPPPAGYTGAVGTFRATSRMSAGPFRVGEPVTLSLQVEGRGSFDRLTTTGVSGTDALSTYEPHATFSPGREPTEGSKVFSQTLVPRRPGTLDVPGVALVTFDPQRHRYVTERTRPISLAVADAAENESPSAGPTNVAVPPVAAAAPRARFAASTTPSTTRRSLVPAIRQAWFWWVAVGLVVVAVVGSLAGSLAVRRRAVRLLGRRERARLLAQARRRMDAAVAAGDAPALFGAARSGLQACLAPAWSVAAEAISAADVEARLGARGERLRELFEQADRCTYGGDSRSTPENLERWRRVAAEELEALEEVA